MSQWVHRGVSRHRPKGDSYEEGYDLTTGHASASLITPPMTQKELAAYRRALQQKDAKRKPAGFAPWPDDGDDRP